VQRGVHDRAQHLIEREAVGDGLAHLVERERLLEADVLGGQLLLLEPAADGVDHLLHLEGLEDVVVRAALHGVDGGLDRAEARHDHGDHVGHVLGDGLQQLEPAHVGHLQVAEHQVVVGAGQLDQGGGAVFGGAHPEALHGQEVGQDLADDLLVVHHEQARRIVAGRGAGGHVRQRAMAERVS
jgi:hypothetical protein